MGFLVREGGAGAGAASGAARQPWTPRARRSVRYRGGGGVKGPRDEKIMRHTFPAPNAARQAVRRRARGSARTAHDDAV